MKFKRLGSLALASALSLSLAAPAFAAGAGDTTTDPETPSNNNETVITGVYQDTPVAVYVPTTGNTFINPYGIGVELEAPDNSKYQIKGQIATEPLYIVNQSNMDLKVSATVSAAINANSTMKLATETTKEHTVAGEGGSSTTIPAATAKSAYVYMQMKKSTATVSASDYAADTAMSKIENAVFSDCAAASWSTDFNAANKDVVLGVKPATAEEILTLKAATFASGNISAYPPDSVAVFRLSGDAVATPKVAWDENDGFTANIVFTFIPA